jgi:type IV pilus assembly protein PilB
VIDRLRRILGGSADAPRQQDPSEEEGERQRRLAAERGLVFAEPGELLERLDLELAARVDREWQEKERAIPIRLEDGVLVVASDAPGGGLRRLQRLTGAREVETRVVTPTAFRRLLWAVDLGELPGRIEPSGLGGDDLLTHDLRAEARSVALLESMLVDAVAARASDIHLEHQRSGPRVRVRIDGELRELTHFALDRSVLTTVVRVAKVKAGLDIAEQRAPQGGQFATRVGDDAFFVRVQSQPTIHGENVAMRLLPEEPEHRTLAELGFAQEAADRYRRTLVNPGGLVLVVGPTGSGKTTTLYAGLRLLAEETTRKVISIEDPVEYVCDGVQQVEINPEVGFGFGEAMRSFVREDPDVILLGEIRDHETALEAIRASQTGHLVLSSLHCNDAVDAVQRLLDLGMHPSSLSSELLAVFAQRLAPRICVACREEVEPSLTVAAEVFPSGAPEGFRAWRGRGCEACAGTGTRGRIALVEMLEVTPGLRRAVSQGALLDDLRRKAGEAGLVSLRERALSRAGEGTIAFESLPRCLPLDRLRPAEV